MLRRVSPARALKPCTYSSARRLVAPITEVGFTALSEEIMTKRPTPAATEASAIDLVPNTLLVTAWAGWSSMSGTCLCAAAWRTTSGRIDASSSRVLCSSTTSCSSALRGSSACLDDSCRSISNRAFSARSTRAISAGSNRAHRRDNSEPIEPPAPVMSTRLPVTMDAMAGLSGWCGARPMSAARSIWVPEKVWGGRVGRGDRAGTARLALSSSSVVGTNVASTPKRRMSDRRRSVSDEAAAGRLTTASVAPTRSQSSARCSSDDTTGRSDSSTGPTSPRSTTPAASIPPTPCVACAMIARRPGMV